MIYDNQKPWLVLILLAASLVAYGKGCLDDILKDNGDGGDKVQNVPADRISSPPIFPPGKYGHERDGR